MNNTHKQKMTPNQIQLLTQLQRDKTRQFSNPKPPLYRPPTPPKFSAEKKEEKKNDDDVSDKESKTNDDDDDNMSIIVQTTSISVSLSWTEEIDYLLFQLFMHCKLLAAQHHTRYTFFRNRLKRYRIPIIIFSAFNAYIAVGFQPYMAQTTISTINSVISLFCGILTSIELFLNVQKKMEKELVSYNNFYRLSVDIMKMLWINKTDRKEDGGKFLEKKYNEYLNCIESGNAGRPSQYKNIFEKIGDEYVNKVFDDPNDLPPLPPDYHKFNNVNNNVNNNVVIDESSSSNKQKGSYFNYNNSEPFPVLMFVYRNMCCCFFREDNSSIKKQQIYKDYEEYKKHNCKKSYFDIAKKGVTKIIAPNEYVAGRSQEEYDSKMKYVNHQYQSKTRLSHPSPMLHKHGESSNNIEMHMEV